MSEDLDKRLAEVTEDRLREVLGNVDRIVSNPEVPRMDAAQLASVLADALEAMTSADLLKLMRDRLTSITEKAPDDMIAVANLSVRMLKRSADADPAVSDQIGDLLVASDGESDYELGKFIINNNPYFPPTNDLVSAQQLVDATDDVRQGGPFRPFTSSFRWNTTRPGFPRIPHPDDPAPAIIPDYQPSWYMLSGRTPKSLPDDIMTLPDPPRSRVRNIVKTIEIEYGTDTLFTGEIIGGVPKEKAVHIFIMYAGGNGT